MSDFFFVFLFVSVFSWTPHKFYYYPDRETLFFVIAFLFLGRLGEGLKKNPQQMAGKKRTKWRICHIVFEPNFACANLKKKLLLCIFWSKIINDVVWIFFLCPCFSLNIFFALSKHHAYGQKENYCRNIDAPARVLFQKN